MQYEIFMNLIVLKHKILQQLQNSVKKEHFSYTIHSVQIRIKVWVHKTGLQKCDTWDNLQGLLCRNIPKYFILQFPKQFARNFIESVLIF